MSSSGNSAFAFVVNSLLNSNKNAKLLSKAKKESDITYNSGSKKPIEKLEIVNDLGDVIEEVEQINDSNKNNNSANKPLIKDRFRKIDIESIGRIKPNTRDRDYERKMSAIATKGVVQLFNVVKEQQKQINSKLTEVGSSGQKRAKVLSEFTEDRFLQKVNRQSIKHDLSVRNKKEETKKKSFLSENFMAGDKFKNWDVESEEEDDDNDI